MKTQLLLLTHDNTGATLLNAATTILGSKQLPLSPVSFSIFKDTDPKDLLINLNEWLVDNKNFNLLIFTDLYGSTPSNIAFELQKNAQIKTPNKQIAIVSGLNLAMLLRVMNYPDLELSELIEIAVSGGKDGIVSGRKITRSKKNNYC